MFGLGDLGGAIGEARDGVNAIVNQLSRIADALETANALKALELRADAGDSFNGSELASLDRFINRFIGHDGD